MRRVQEEQVVQVALIPTGGVGVSLSLGSALSGLVALNAYDGARVPLMLKVQWRLACRDTGSSCYCFGSSSLQKRASPKQNVDATSYVSAAWFCHL